MKRCYKPAFSIEKSIEIMREGRSSHFDPQIVDIFFDHLDEIRTIYETYKD
jgi:putative two-component system response regulator